MMYHAMKAFFTVTGVCAGIIIESIPSAVGFLAAFWLLKAFGVL